LYSGPGADACDICDEHYYSPAGSVIKAACEYKYCPAGRYLDAKSGECDVISSSSAKLSKKIINLMPF